jgi:hypothetical protein
MPTEKDLFMRQWKRCEMAIRLQRYIALSGRLVFVLLGVLMILQVSAGPGSAPADCNVFAGRDERVVVKGLEGLPAGEMQVSYSISKESRTIARGTARVESDGSVALSVRLPELKPGVAMRFDLELRAGSDQGQRVKQGTLWTFSELPLVTGYKPTGERQLMLYDPAGDTEKAFQSIGLAYESANRLEAVADATNAVIIVGEGVSLEKERALGDVMTAAVMRGNRVLLLAPTEGVIRPPAGAPWRLVAGAASAVLGGARKAGAPSLDLGAFPPAKPLNRAFFRFNSETEGTTVTVSPDSGEQAVGWDYVQRPGRFRACGLGVVENWDKTPAMRWFLIDMVEELNKEK